MTPDLLPSRQERLRDQSERAAGKTGRVLRIPLGARRPFAECTVAPPLIVSVTMTKPLWTTSSPSTATPSSPTAISIAAASTSPLASIRRQRLHRSAGREAERCGRLDAGARKPIEAIGQKAQALDDFRTALEVNPRLESAREGFDRIMTKQRQPDRQK
jgi:hypothetical protein